MRTKYCNKCEKELDITIFDTNVSRPDGHQVYCRDCYSLYHKAWYLKNKEEAKARTKNRNAKYRIILQSYVVNYLRTNHCVDCGNDNILVLDFDHVNGEKVNNVTNMVRNCISLETLKLEIEKCEIRCRNCHSIRTHKNCNSYKFVALAKWERSSLQNC